MQMKAAVLYGPRDVRIDEVEAPVAGEGGMIVRIKACGVCPTDVRFYTGAREGITYPRTTGHEWVGEVLEVGPGVKGYQPGDRVGAYVQRVCGMCHNCQRGLFNMCLNRLPSIRGGFMEIGWALPEAVERLPEGLSFTEASFAEPLACCLNGVMRTPIAPGDTVAIVGTGPIGQLLAQLARVRGARVLAIDLDTGRLALAKQLGAAETIVADAKMVQAVMDLTGGRGAEAAIVAVGSAQAEQSAFQIVGQGATINYFAGTYPPTTIAIDPNIIHYKQLMVTGSYHFTPAGFRTALDLLARGAVQVAPLISHRLPLEETGQAFETVATRGGMKVIVQMNGEL